MKTAHRSISGTGAECAGACKMADGCAPLRDAPCVRMSMIHAETRDLCDQLEAIADSLPYGVDRLKCLGVANRLVPALRSSHRYEEDVLFPAFVRDLTRLAANTATVGRLRSEHIFDECAAEEITEELMRIGHGRPVVNPEALGFMLRAFFETVRRHVAFESEYMFSTQLSLVVSLAGKA